MNGPEHRDLRRVVAALAARLPDHLEGMLDDDRFEVGRAALERLSDPAHARELDTLDPVEAAWLGEELRRRWAALGDVVLDPFAWITATSTVDATASALLSVHADGLEPGWSVAWSGADADESDPTLARWTPPHPVTARVMGRGPGGRVILAATWGPPAEPAGPEDADDH